MVWPETESAVQTMPAMAITKNMPVVPERPKRSSTTEEMMMVSMVMPETGLRAVVAMALAATEVKKKEKTQRQRQRRRATTAGEAVESAEEDADAEGARRPRRAGWSTTGDVAVGALAGRVLRRARKARSATPKEPATMRRI